MSSREPASAADLGALVRARIDSMADELIEFRRDLHAHPELSWGEERTAGRVADRLTAAGLTPSRVGPSGVTVDIGPLDSPVVALRADLDALPVSDLTPDPWRSTVEGIAHACGHDVHTSALLGAGIALAGVADRLTRRVRLVFQPAEEIMPGGALAMIEAGALKDVESIFMLHCDPATDVGLVGLREGPQTGAADSLTVVLRGRGGHTSRPHLTEDLTFALAKLVTELPAVLSRRLDPRSGVSVVWGLVQTGSAANVIPSVGRAAGTVRMLDALAWADAETLVTEAIGQLMSPYGVTAEITYVRGVPPVVNAPGATAALASAIVASVGYDGLVATSQSLGGEDFAWYLEQVPGALGRLGTRTPGGLTYDLHQGDLRVDERAVLVGAKVLATTGIGAEVTDR